MFAFIEAVKVKNGIITDFGFGIANFNNNLLATNSFTEIYENKSH